MPILQPGDKIAIISPAGSVKIEQIDINIKFIENQKWIPILGKNAFNEYFFGYNYAGTEIERVEDFQWALDQENIKAIWCTRGGYGGVHLIDKLDFSKFKKFPKWLIGYSDNTVFHQYLSSKNIPSLHACVLKNLPQGHSKGSFKSITSVLKGKDLHYKIKSEKYNNSGKAKGILSGGNLSIIYSLMGSNTIDNFANKILFIEDWLENWYHLDRMLMCMERAGVFKNLCGIIVGGFTKMDDKTQENYEQKYDARSYDIINYRLKKYTFPKIYGFPAGHIYDNRALVFGKEVLLDVNEEFTIVDFQI